MAGGNLAAGLIMVLAVLIITAFVAFLQTDATPSGDEIGCDSNGNTTTCEGGSPQSFIDAFFDVAITGIEDAPAAVNGFYVLIMGAVLIIGFALVVAGIIGIPLGGG